MKNPITVTREKLEISRDVLALMARVSYSTVAANEAGRFIEPSENILKVFGKLGYDPEKIRKKYAKWREEKRPAIMAR